MLEPRKMLRAYLLADSAVGKAVGTRVYYPTVPAGAQKPLIVIYPNISRVPSRDLGGVAYRRVRIQVTAMADTQPEAEAAAHAVINAVEGFNGKMYGVLPVILATVDNDRQVYQDEVDEIHHHVDVMITYKEE